MRRSGQAEGIVVLAEFETEGFDDEVMVIALCEAGNGDGGNQAGMDDADGKATAVAGIVGSGKAASFERRLLLLEIEADRVGTAMEAEDYVGLAADPLGVIGCGAGKSAVEERLQGTANIDDDGKSAVKGKGAKAGAETPGDLLVEGRKDESAFLERDAGEILGQ